MDLVYLVFVALAVAFALLAVTARRRNMHIWLASYAGQVARRRFARHGGDPVHVMFCFVDHFEPRWGNPSQQEESRRVDEWCKRYPVLTAGHRDADGQPPKHTFFFPEEEYRPEHIDRLVDLCQQGLGEIDVHLHHDNDTEAGLRDKLQRFTGILDRRHGALPVNPDDGRPMFAFIHGNWCLDNSRRDGRWCGVNNELIVLREMGCYADFTLPSAPSDTQTGKINGIYYAKDDPRRPKSHNGGVDVEVGGTASGDLMIIQGPLALDWRNRKWGLIPRIENSDIRRSAPPTPSRVDLWVRQGIHVKGRPDWIFVKIHTHGTQARDMDVVLGEPVAQMFSYLETKYNDGKRYCLHYVTAREMYNIIKAAEMGRSGNPGHYRDSTVPRPPMLTQNRKDRDSCRS